ncbi:hypothetical protein XBKB1_2970024 [Xenorhabdus bovienii str. kraussei Becker Underwood]|uniref:Uncharacterized protein n=1 Tax=Xenorhabdus bovienii str. kraussei Becker Underwood TaxID=1398204 RepID=A0A077PJH1_XENBV|nr:hypothetical protein XBKB1_2970024 [Xenorhabdus bovienii str. kraussei Becker Underwood]
MTKKHAIYQTSMRLILSESAPVDCEFLGFYYAPEPRLCLA